MSAADYTALQGFPGDPGQAGPSMFDQPQQQAPPQVDALQSLQDAIHSVTAAMVALPDPQDTQDAIGALQALARVQTRLMKAAGPGGSAQG